MENIHSETYALLIDTHIKAPQEKQKRFYAIGLVPAVREKEEYAALDRKIQAVDTGRQISE